VFESAVIPAGGQGLLASPGQWGKLLDQLPDFPTDNGDTTLKTLLAAEWAKASNTPEQRWRQLRDSVRRLIDLAGGSLAKGFGGGGGGGGGGGAGGKGRAGGRAVKMTTRQRMDLERLVPAIVFTYTFPRLDVEVSKHRNHLLKAPFCVHPKTGRVCVPINPATADAFDPTTVPTVARLQDEGTEWAKRTGRGAYAAQKAGGAGAGAGDDGDDTMSEASSTTAGGSSSASASTASAAAKARGDMDGMVEATSLRTHVRAFEAFVKTCEAETWRAIRASDAAAAAYTGEW
jgi:hypothetical protein